MVGEGWLGKRVVAKTAYNHSVQGLGTVIAYCDVPSVMIERDDGTHFHWRADMCELAPDEPVTSEQGERYRHTLRKIATHNLNDPFGASAMQQWAAEALDAAPRGAGEE